MIPFALDPGSLDTSLYWHYLAQKLTENHRFLGTGSKNVPDSTADTVPKMVATLDRPLKLLVSKMGTAATNGVSQWGFADDKLVLEFTHSKNSGNLFVTIYSTEDNARELISKILGLFPTPPKRADEVQFAIWNNGRNGANFNNRRLDCPTWESIKGNYSAEAASSIDWLVNLQDPLNFGRIILWHGPPGQGKTYAIRALARAWQHKLNATAEIILDHDVLFASAEYLKTVFLDDNAEEMLYEDDGMEKKPGPRLIIIEDGASLFGTNCRNRQGFSTFLNLGDGIVGQGTKTIFLLTANEDIGQIDPAILRPGRCLQELEILPLTDEEKAAWLSGRNLPTDDVGGIRSLADLYARALGKPIPSEPKLSGVGF